MLIFECKFHGCLLRKVEIKKNKIGAFDEKDFRKLPWNPFMKLTKFGNIIAIHIEG
jgi:hypothetical protein